WIGLCTKWKTHIFFSKGQDESDSLSDEQSSSHEDVGTDYVDSDQSDIEEFLNSEEVELLQPLPPRTSQQHTQIILTWLVYFVLVWQYKNYISDNAIEEVLKFVQQFLFCIGQLINDHTDLFLVLATNLPTTLYSARKMLKIDRDNFIQYVVCPRCTKLYLMDDIVVNDCRQTFARTCEHVAFPQSRRPRTCGSQLAQKVVVRNDIGRLPGNISSNYGGYTAAQWKNFVLLFSFCKAQLESKERYSETSLFPQLILASCGPLRGKESMWADLTSVCFESSYKLASLDQSELSTLLKVYLTIYPKETEGSLKLLYKKYKSLKVGGE
ncbi:hypothetical protein P5673_022327, partial [Acropora cervicornis]